MPTNSETSFLFNQKLILIFSLGVVVNSPSQIKLLWQMDCSGFNPNQTIPRLDEFKCNKMTQKSK